MIYFYFLLRHNCLNGIFVEIIISAQKKKNGGSLIDVCWMVNKQTLYVLLFEPTFHSYLLKAFSNLEAPTVFLKLANV
jgi:hypothetical protein